MIVAFDIGGSAIKSAWAHTAEAISPIERVPTPLADFADFVAALKSSLAKAPSRPEAVAISITGVTDPETGTLICANVPAIHGRLLASDLTEALGVPVVIANDADCFALAEARLGAGQGHEIVFGVILGTGVGGGLVVQGKLANQNGGYAGEWGHGTILATRAGTPAREIAHFACGCGRSGCVDTVGGARGLERLDAHLHGAVRDSMTILAGWERGEPAARTTLEVYLDLVSTPLALAINITGATVVPVGGGLANSHGLVGALDSAVRTKTLRTPPTQLLVPAQTGIEPGLIGAALMGLDLIDDKHA